MATRRQVPADGLRWAIKTMNPDEQSPQFDSSVVALMHGLKSAEGTNGNYNTIGDQGTAAGIGQWSNETNGKPQKLNPGDIPANFKGQAQQYSLNPNDFSPENQNKVMYAHLSAQKKSGLQPEQILSAWNSGDPNKYQNAATSTGTGPVGAYNVSSYVKRAMAAAQQYAKENGQSSGQQMLSPGVPALQISGQNQEQTQNQDKGFLGNLFSGNVGGAAKNAMDFAFPIIGDVMNDMNDKNQKTVLQQLGDAGLSALWFIPGLGEGAGLGAKILQGAGIGYGAGALSQLSGGKDLASSFSPNSSNLIGAATGGVAGGVLSKLSGFLGKNVTQEGAINAVQDNLTSAMNGTKSGSNLLKELQAKGHDPMALIARSNAIPDIVEGKFDTTAASEVIQKNLGQIGQLRSAALDQSGVRGSLPILKNQILDTIDSTLSGTERTNAIDLTNKEFASLANQYGKQPSASTMETIKEYLQGRGKYDTATPNITTNAYRTMASAAKNQMEAIAEKSGIPNIGKLNKLMSQHYSALSALEKMNGQTVKGGRLGNILRGHTIAGISAIGANAMGGGLLGTLTAALGGEGANALLSKILGDTSFTNPIRDAVLKKMELENPEIVKAIQSALAGQGKLPPNLMGGIGGQLAPKSSRGTTGLIPKTLTTAAARGATGLISR